MSRQVDVKALVSHIVRGDGADKCRICMGDTSEGQVYLGDTVMLDGSRPVTLSELLETITGVEVSLEDELPSGLCSPCSIAAIEAGNFRVFCQEAAKQWESNITLIENLPTGITRDTSKAMYFILNKDEVICEFMVKEYEEPKHKIHERFNQKKASKHAKVYKMQCPDCEKGFGNPRDMYLHFQHSTEQKCACYVCAEIMTQQDLKKHLAKTHEQRPYLCKKCPAMLPTSADLSFHMAKIHKHGGHSCGDCSRTFKSSFSLHAHSGVHQLKTCPGCDTLFRNHMCYLYHVKQCCDLDITNNTTHRTKHKVTVEVKNVKSNKKVKVGLRGSAVKESYCDYCGKKFAAKKFVTAHIQIVHLKNTHKACAYCGKSLAAAHMTQHLKSHESTNLYTCEQCGLVLRSKLGYQQHLRLHTGELPYSCKYCGDSFSASSRRSEHIRKVHRTGIELKHKCHLCTAQFRLPYKLRKHLDTVHSDEAGDRPQYECNICHEKFGSCRGLVHHGKKHQTISIKNALIIEGDLEE